jgi:hypothetical protein
MPHGGRFGSVVAQKCPASRFLGDKWATLGRERGKTTQARPRCGFVESMTVWGHVERAESILQRPELGVE